MTHLDVSREACERAAEILVELAEGRAGRVTVGCAMMESIVESRVNGGLACAHLR